jgi:hypothetical protein
MFDIRHSKSLTFSRSTFGRLTFGRSIFVRLKFGRLTFGRLTFGRLTFNHRPVFLRATKKAGRKLSGCTKSTEIGTREQIKSVLANIRDRCYFIILKNILAKKIDKTLATFCSKYCYFFSKIGS